MHYYLQACANHVRLTTQIDLFSWKSVSVAQAMEYHAWVPQQWKLVSFTKLCVTDNDNNQMQHVTTIKVEHGSCRFVRKQGNLHCQSWKNDDLFHTCFEALYWFLRIHRWIIINWPIFGGLFMSTLPNYRNSLRKK